MSMTRRQRALNRLQKSQARRRLLEEALSLRNRIVAEKSAHIWALEQELAELKELIDGQAEAVG